MCPLIYSFTQNRPDNDLKKRSLQSGQESQSPNRDTALRYFRSFIRGDRTFWFSIRATARIIKEGDYGHWRILVKDRHFHRSAGQRGHATPFKPALDKKGRV